MDDLVIQVVIAITGVIAIWLANDQREHWRKYACIFGLAGQPFWIYTTYTAGQWGVLVLAIFYTVAWGKGFLRYWI